jgi:hypothetical protein
MNNAHALKKVGILTRAVMIKAMCMAHVWLWEAESSKGRA